MRRLIHLLTTASAFALGGVTAANAIVVDLTAATNFSGTFVATSSNTLVEIGGPAGVTGVTQQDKLWDNFNFAAGDLIQFTFSHVGTHDFHTITISDPNFSGSGATVGYNISVLPASTFLLSSVSGAVVQTDGSAHVVTTLTPNSGSAGPLDFNVTSPPPVYVGTTVANFAPGTTSVGVVDTVTPNLGGSTVSAVSNSFVENAVPGPVPGAGLGGMMALLGLGLLARARGFLAH